MDRSPHIRLPVYKLSPVFLTEEEMAELEEKIRKQRDVLRRLREVGLEIKKGRELRQQNGGRDAMES